MPGQPPVGAPNATIEQGPAWLVDLYLTPPAWVNPAIRVIGILAVLVVAYRLHRWGWEVDAETQLAVGRIGATVVAVITGVLAMANLASQPYVLDVALGCAAGWGSVTVALSAPARRGAAEYIPEPETRLAAAWCTLALLSLLGPALVSVHGRGTALTTGRVAVAGVAVAMVVLNLRERRARSASEF